MDKLQRLGGSIVVGAAILVGLALLVLLFERAGPEEGDARPPVQPVQQQIEQLRQRQDIYDREWQERRLQKLERDLWDRENARRISGNK